MFKSILKTIAPIVGGIVGGPGGAALAHKVSNILLPGVKNPSDNELERALQNATTEQVIAIKKLEMETEARIYESEVNDRKSARKMNIKTGDKTVRNVMYLFTFAFVCISFLHFFMPNIDMKYYSEHLVEMTMTALGFFCGRLNK